MGKAKRYHWYLAMYRTDDGRIFGSWLTSRNMLKRYLSSPEKFEDVEIEANDIFEALQNVKSVRRQGRLIIIHYVT